MKSGLALMALSAVSAVPLFCQPTEPAPVIQVLREVIKEGKTAAHEKTEMEFVRIFRKAKFPGYYYALTTISGPNEAWFISVFPSFAEAEEYQKLADKEPLKGELGLADARDGALRESSRSMWAVYRKDMSYLPDKFDPAHARYAAVAIYRVKLGKDEEMESGAKMMIGGYEKANIATPFLCYQVVAGAPVGTYLFFDAMDSLKVMDGQAARHKALMEAMGAENFQQLMKGAGEIFQFMEESLFAVNPGMSYVSKEVEEADPAFWRPKPPAKKPAEAKPKEKEKAAQ
jgi:hypothetical protein